MVLLGSPSFVVNKVKFPLSLRTRPSAVPIQSAPPLCWCKDKTVSSDSECASPATGWKLRMDCTCGS